MLKDYQEIERTAKDLWRHIHFLSGENDARAILRITQALTTYGNARYEEGIKEGMIQYGQALEDKGMLQL